MENSLEEDIPHSTTSLPYNSGLSFPQVLFQIIYAEDNFEKRGASQCGLAIYIRKYLKAKEEL
jgi:hypothetical protein